MSHISFGLDLPATVSTDDPVHMARTAEALGYDFVSASDHPAGTDPSYETWTMLAFVAAGTSRIGIATRVLGVPYRPPAMVAKMAETLGRLSGGRLILGLGGGASDDEFRQLGLPVPTPREKVQGLEEAVKVIRGLWTQRDFTYTGATYRTDRANIEPKPETGIPIWFGTFGPRALELTGRVADGWIPSLGFAPEDRLPLMRDAVLESAERAGRDPSTITTALNLAVELDTDPDDGLVAGPAEAVAERLAAFARKGFTTLNVKVPDGPGRDEQVERIAKEVLPLVRSS
jgi:probable F420-dependent oxidoreductase